MKKKLDSILLIDDDEMVNYLNKFVIKHANLTEKIVTSLNGKEALEFLSNTEKLESNGDTKVHPLLIFLDINMPVMDGWEFMEAYQKMDLSQKDKIIIVMLTTSANPDDRSRAKIFPEINEFRNKPLSKEILEDIMQKYFAEYL